MDSDLIEIGRISADVRRELDRAGHMHPGQLYKIKHFVENQRAVNAEGLSTITEVLSVLPESERLWIESRLNSALADIIQGYMSGLGSV